MTIWSSRTAVNNTSWGVDRFERWTKSRDYALGSFFTDVLAYISDPKDWLGIRIKTDPAYAKNPTRWSRTKTENTTWKARTFSL